MLVMPGLINCHLHLGTNAPHTFFLDATKSDYFGANFYAYSVPRRGAPDARAGTRPDLEQLYGLLAAIRGGATTVLDIGSRNPGKLVPGNRRAHVCNPRTPSHPVPSSSSKKKH